MMATGELQMPMPRPDDTTLAHFHAILPEDARIAIRPMFGNLAGFVNGNMFTGVFGSGVFVRLPPDDRTELLAIPGAAIFAPMEGRPMTEYVTMPDHWRDEPDP